MPENYTAYTLVDITYTSNINHRSKNTIAYNQTQNTNTIIQLAGIRSQPVSFAVTEFKAQDLAEYRFGKQFTGLHSVWKFKFAVEHSGVFNLDNNPVHFLIQDFDGVAFTPYLGETVNFSSSTFETIDPKLLNIYFTFSE